MDTIFPYLRYDGASGNFGEGADYAFDTTTKKGQHVLQPYWQIASKTGAFPVSDPITKRFTIQVGTLDYAAAEADYRLTTDMQSTTVLMDFNTEDLYTKERGSSDWDGVWPQYDRPYANTIYGDDTDTVRPIKGAPLRFRKIPLCTTQGTGYFYTLASAPYIVTGHEGTFAKETGYLSDWDPLKTQLSIDCCGTIITGNNIPVDDEMTYDESLLQTYSNIYSGITKNDLTCEYDLTFRSITGAGCIETVQDGNIIFISGQQVLTGNNIPVDDEMTFDESLLQTYSNIYSGNKGLGCSGDFVFRSITGAGCIETVQDGNIIFISGEQVLTGNNIPVDDEMTFDESLLQTYSNIYSGNKGLGCSGDFVFRSITGVGGVETTQKGNIIQISGISGIAHTGVTGIGCMIGTYLEDETIYITGNTNFYDSINDSNILQDFTNNACGSGINFYNITGDNGLGSDIQTLEDGKTYIRITGGGFSSITGNDCMVGTYKENDTIYITGNKNFYDSTNNSNLISGFTDNSCGSGISFYHITGAEGLGSDRQTIDGQEYIRITGKEVGTDVNITGGNCIETKIEQVDAEDYITVNFTGAVVTTGNTSTSNLFQSPSFDTDSEGCSANSKILKLKNIVGETGISIESTDTELDINLDCPFGGANGWDLDPADANSPGTNNPLHDCGFRLKCVEMCDDSGNTFAAVIPVRFLAADGTWASSEDTSSTCS